MLRPFVVLLALVAVAQAVNQQACSVTVGDVEGPYYQAGAPTQRGYVCQHSPALDRLRLTGQVQQQDCATPLQATLDVWQANEAGYYSEGSSRDSQDYLCRAIIQTDERGIFSFVTRMPGRYDDGGYRPAHIHFKITPVNTAFASLTTQLYFAGDTYLGLNDSCARCMSGNPTLQAKVVHNADIKTYEGNWNIVLAPRSAYESGQFVSTNFDGEHEGHNYHTVQAHIQVASTQTLLQENQKLRATLAAVAHL